MKKLIIVLILLVGFSAFAQNTKATRNRTGRDSVEKLSLEQRNLLMLKKMTLELDLNTKQQEQIKPIIAEQIAKREVQKSERLARKQRNEKLSADAIFEMKSKMLDQRIATKKRMEKILNAKQYEKWASLEDNYRQERQKKSQKGNKNCNQQCSQQGKRQRQG